MIEFELIEFLRLLTFAEGDGDWVSKWNSMVTIPWVAGDAPPFGAVWAQVEAGTPNAWSRPSRFLGIILFSSLCGLIVGLIAAWTGSRQRRVRRCPDDSRLSKPTPPWDEPRRGWRWWNPRTWFRRRRNDSGSATLGFDPPDHRAPHQVPPGGKQGDGSVTARFDEGHATTDSSPPPVLLSLPDFSPAPDDERARQAQREVARRFERIAGQLRMGVPTHEIAREYGYTPAQVELIRESVTLIEHAWHLDETVTSSRVALNGGTDGDTQLRFDN